MLDIRTKIFVFLGPPGAGKGSLSNMCIEYFQWTQLSTGNLCRKHIAEGTQIGKEIDFAIKSGKLISDGLISEMVENWLIEVEKAKSIILDGYPRTLNQAESMHQWLKDNESKFALKVVKLVVSEDTVVSRLTKRIVCGNKDCQAVYSACKNSALSPKSTERCDRCSSNLVRRGDDDLSAIKERLAIYKKHEGDLIQFFNSVGKDIIALNVERPIKDVFLEFAKSINLESSLYDYNKK